MLKLGAARELKAGVGGADFSLQRRLQPASGHRLKPMLQAKVFIDRTYLTL
jgi:hypothetical protein